MTIKISTAKIKKEWTDYNGHMNVAYYILIFDQNAAETLMTKLDMGEKSALETNKSTMVVESHITYNQELIEGDEVELNLNHIYKFLLVDHITISLLLHLLKKKEPTNEVTTNPTNVVKFDATKD